MAEVLGWLAATLFTLILILVTAISIAAVLSFIVDILTEYTDNRK